MLDYGLAGRLRQPLDDHIHVGALKTQLDFVRVFVFRFIVLGLVLTRFGLFGLVAGTVPALSFGGISFRGIGVRILFRRRCGFRRRAFAFLGGLGVFGRILFGRLFGRV